MDLSFAEAKVLRLYNCSKCPESNRNKRKCQEMGLLNFDKPFTIDEFGIKLHFCAAKATWYPEIRILFEQCRIALETGILPKPGHLEDQSEKFVEVFGYFIERWKERSYYRVWKDVIDFTPKVLEQLAKIFGRALGGK